MQSRRVAVESGNLFGLFPDSFFLSLAHEESALYSMICYPGWEKNKKKKSKKTKPPYNITDTDRV